jgi:cobalt-zinc-cadmium efflux system outer membrane protein
MKRIVTFCFLTGVGFLVFGQSLFAEENAATNEVILNALVNHALANNPELNFYRAEIAAAKGERRSAGAWENPEAEFSLGGKRATERGGNLAGEGLAWSVSVSQTFDYPGRIALRKAIANRQVALAENGLKQFQAALAAKVRLLGYRLLIARELADSSQEIARRGEELVETLVQRESAGVTPLLEKRIIEASVITLKREAGNAEKDAQAALFEINQLRGEPLNAPLTIAKTTLKFPPLPPVENLLAAARTNNFELRQKQIELEQQGFKVELSKKDRLPDIKVAPFYSEERAGEKEQTIGVGVSVPLPLWNRNKGNIEAAEARRVQAETSWRLEERRVERAVREEALAYQIQFDEITRLQPDSLNQLREASELGDRHYRLGAIPVSTYVELQTQYLEALEAILHTQADALENLQQLESLTGTNLRATP